jgi:hypothetical protein
LGKVINRCFAVMEKAPAFVQANGFAGPLDQKHIILIVLNK